MLNVKTRLTKKEAIAFRVLKHGSTLERLIIFSRDVCLNPEDSISVYFDDFLASGSDMHKGVVCARSEKVQPDDLANILYTSGTTGLSKGVMLTHEMLNTAVASHYGVFPLSEKDVVLNFLPFTHVLERGWALTIFINTSSGFKLFETSIPSAFSLTLEVNSFTTL